LDKEAIEELENGEINIFGFGHVGLYGHNGMGFREKQFRGHG
jgi:hypothetical protein